MGCDTDSVAAHVFAHAQAMLGRTRLTSHVGPNMGNKATQRYQVNCDDSMPLSTRADPRQKFTCMYV